MEHFTVTFEPDRRQVSIHAGATLVETAGRAGIILNTVCGGKGICGKCQVILKPSGRQVQACQYHVQSHLVVTVPPTSRFFEQKILSEGIAPQRQIQPDIYSKYLEKASGGRILGAAVDIGTSTVVAKLLDMITGRCTATQSATNPQARYGDDVISRLRKRTD
jgi:uncharacterized 2Fe-2S/4Fe-4S cluster protein (DUF4445 family)